MAFLQERGKIKRNKAKFGRKVRCLLHALQDGYTCLKLFHQNIPTVPFRVESYIDGGLDKDLIDPDNGENIERKRRKLGIVASNNAVVDDMFMFPPSTAMWKGIADGRTLLPQFSLANMMAYIVARKVCDGQIAGDFKRINNHSYPLFKAGHIQRIRVIKGNNNVHLSGVCLPEMRKDREYKIQMILSPSEDVLFAEDGCPAGKGPTGSCKHIAAFCYALEEFVRLGFTRPFLSCTSRLQTWNQPRQKKLHSKNIYEISFERAEYGKVRKSHLKPFPQKYNAISPKHHQEQFDGTLKLSNLCKGLSKPCGFLKVLNTSQSGTSDVEQLPLKVPPQSSSVNVAPCPIRVNNNFNTPFNPFTPQTTSLTVPSVPTLTQGPTSVGALCSSPVTKRVSQPVVSSASPVTLGLTSQDAPCISPITQGESELLIPSVSPATSGPTSLGDSSKSPSTQGVTTLGPKKIVNWFSATLPPTPPPPPQYGNQTFPHH